MKIRKGLETTDGSESAKSQAHSSNQTSNRLPRRYRSPQEEMEALDQLSGVGLHFEASSDPLWTKQQEILNPENFRLDLRLQPSPLTPSSDHPVVRSEMITKVEKHDEFDHDNPTVTPSGYHQIKTREAARAKNQLAQIQMGRQVIPLALSIIRETMTVCVGLVWSEQTIEERARQCATALVPYLRTPVEDDTELPVKAAWECNTDLCITWGSGTWDVTVREFPKQKYPIPAKLAQLLITTSMMKADNANHPEMRCYQVVRETALSRVADMMGRLVATRFKKDLSREGV